MEPQTDLFTHGYVKFISFIDTYNLLPRDRKKFVIAYSGGKDASLLCDFLCEYKLKERPEIELELLTVNFPRFIYAPAGEDRRKLVKRAVSHWTDRGMNHTAVDPGEDFPDSLLDGPEPCQQCALVIKPTLLGREMCKPAYRDAVYCVGLTLDDMLGWFTELFFVTAGRGALSDIKLKSPELYRIVMLLSIRLSASLRVANNNLLYARPLMNFSDNEVRAIVASRELPLIPEDCGKILGRDDVSDAPRRELGMVFAALRKKYTQDSTVGRDAFFSDYRRATSFIEQSGLLPSLEERENFVALNLKKYHI